MSLDDIHKVVPVAYGYATRHQHPITGLELTLCRGRPRAQDAHFRVDPEQEALQNLGSLLWIRGEVDLDLHSWLVRDDRNGPGGRLEKAIPDIARMVDLAASDGNQQCSGGQLGKGLRSGGKQLRNNPPHPMLGGLLKPPPGVHTRIDDKREEHVHDHAR